MRFSEYLLATLKEAPKDAETLSHKLMIRAGMIRKIAAGIYNFLPIGLKVFRKVENIIREEMNNSGAVEVMMPFVTPSDLWIKSGRWDLYGKELLRLKDRADREFCLGPTHEEVVTDLVDREVKSYRNLPLTVYQIQPKFRDEIRPRFGVMRGREFYMKDGYNFDLTKEDALHSYNRHLVSYLKTYERMGLRAIPMRADSGPIGGEDTHEFLVLAETGESEVFYDSQVTDLKFGNREIDYDDHSACQSVLDEFTSLYARTDETHEPSVFEKIPPERQRKARGIEVGQIFYFGIKYSEAMGATVTDANGDNSPVHMGSHGIGVSRLVGAIIEANHDEKGIMWPEGVTPFHCGIVNLKQGDLEADDACQDIYQRLTNAGLDPLYDDRNERAGGKFATMDLIGLPWRITVGPRGLKNGVVELTSRREGVSEDLTPEEAVNKLISIYQSV